MGKLIVTEFMSLDGVMEAPGGEETHPNTAWSFDYITDERNEYKLKETMEAESQLLGRVTYEGFAAAWPEREGEFADKFNSMPKYVVSTTLEEPLEWENSHLIRGDVAEEIRKLKDESEGPILVAGSATLVKFLIENDLVDELRLMTFPVVIGDGKRTFPDSTEKKHFKLVDTRQFPDGGGVQVYEPA
jgi:dihydrofolate reductase